MLNHQTTVWIDGQSVALHDGFIRSDKLFSCLFTSKFDTWRVLHDVHPDQVFILTLAIRVNENSPQGYENST